MTCEYLEEYLIISKHAVFNIHLFVIGLQFNYNVVREFSLFHKNSLKWVVLLNGLIQDQSSYVPWVLKKSTPVFLKFSLKKSLHGRVNSFSLIAVLNCKVLFFTGDSVIFIFAYFYFIDQCFFFSIILP